MVKKQDVEGRTIVTRNLITLLSFQVEKFPRSFCVGTNLSVCSEKNKPRKQIVRTFLRQHGFDPEDTWAFRLLAFWCMEKSVSQYAKKPLKKTRQVRFFVGSYNKTIRRWESNRYGTLGVATIRRSNDVAGAFFKPKTSVKHYHYQRCKVNCSLMNKRTSGFNSFES